MYVCTYVCMYVCMYVTTKPYSYPLFRYNGVQIYTAQGSATTADAGVESQQAKRFDPNPLTVTKTTVLHVLILD